MANLTRDEAVKRIPKLVQNREWPVWLCRGSVEKIYGWHEGYQTSRNVMLGFLEVWGECPTDRSSGYVDPANLSSDGRSALGLLRIFKVRGAIR